MKIYSIFLVVLMMANFGIMLYKRAEKRIVIICTIVAYVAFVFWNPIGLNRDLLIARGSCIFFLIFSVLTLFLYKKYGSQYFKIIFFVLPWIVVARTLGLPDNPNFGEKNFGLLIVGAFSFTFSLWVFFLLFRQKIYQKILFWIISACLVFLFYCFSGIQDEIEGTIFFPLYIIEMLLAIASYPITYTFFYLGEFLFFLLCYQLFLKDP